MIHEIELLIEGFTLECKAVTDKEGITNLYRDTDSSYQSLKCLLEIPEIYHLVEKLIEAVVENQAGDLE